MVDTCHWWCDIRFTCCEAYDGAGLDSCCFRMVEKGDGGVAAATDVRGRGVRIGEGKGEFGVDAFFRRNLTAVD